MGINARRKARFAFAAAALFALLLGTPGVAFADEDGASTATTASSSIVIVHTNDVHCAVDEHIGYAALASYVKNAEATYGADNVTLVDAGDHVQGKAIGTLSKGDYLIDIMKAARYDLAVPGNHEFDYGMAQFNHFVDKAAEPSPSAGSFPYLSCNFMDLRSNQRVLQDYVIKEYSTARGTTKVAFVGITTPETLTKSSPASFKDADGNFIYGFCQDDSGAKLYAAVQQSVDNARAAGAEYVVAVGHLGQKGVADQWRSDTVVRNTNGINVLIDGHSHEAYEESVPNKDGTDVPIAQTGTQLVNIGVVTIDTAQSAVTATTVELEDETAVAAADESATAANSGPEDSAAVAATSGSESRAVADDASASEDGDPSEQAGEGGQPTDEGEGASSSSLLVAPLSAPPALIAPRVAGGVFGTLVDSWPDKDPAMDQVVKSYQAKIKDITDKVIGHSDVSLIAYEPNSGRQWAVRARETNLGDLVADAYAASAAHKGMAVDCAIVGGGGIREDIAAGDITYGNVIDVQPYNNQLCIVETKGQNILDALEVGARKYPQPNGGFLQVSGMTYAIRTDIPTSVAISETGEFIGVNGPYRVQNVTVGGQPLDVSKTYRLVSYTYYLMDGGDSMSMFKHDAPTLLELDNEALIGFVQNDLHGVIGAAYAHEGGQGRIQVKNGPDPGPAPKPAPEPHSGNLASTGDSAAPAAVSAAALGALAWALCANARRRSRRSTARAARTR